jgi:hypothetical protein
MMGSTLDALHITANKRSHFLWGSDSVAILSYMHDNSSLSKVVGSPSPGITFLVNGKGVIETSMNRHNDLSWESDTDRQKSVLATTINEASSKLVLLTIAPAINITIRIKCQSIVTANTE